jgi:hypothetical protein
MEKMIDDTEMKSMTLKEEIKERFEKMFCTVHRIEIATVRHGVVAVWINGYRTSNYDINEQRFTAED